MPALIALAVLTALVVRYVERQCVLSGRRRIYLGSVGVLLIIGIAAILLYTIELTGIYGKTEQQGDASQYVAAAESVLSGYGTTSFYAIYSNFLAALFWHGGPVIARCGQLLLLICCYSLGALGLLYRGIGNRTFRWFSGLVCFNGIFYGLIVQLVRDILLLTALTLVFLSVILIQRPSKASNVFLNLIPGVSGLALMYALSNWIPYVVIGGVSVDILFTALGRGRSGLRIVAVAVAVAAVSTVWLASDQIATLYHINLTDDGPERESSEALGVGGTGFAMHAFRNIFGPGLLRPIFWEKYFWYSTNVHSALYWWGTVVWYILLLMTVPGVLLRWKRVCSAPGSRFCGFMFITLLATYSAAYGSGVGVRKRAVFQFLVLLAVAGAGLLEPETRSRDWLRSLLANCPKAIVTFGLLVVMVVVNYLSLE